MQVKYVYIKKLVGIALRIILPVIIASYSSGVSAQSNATDSLKKVLQTQQTVRDEVNTLLSLGEIYENENHLDSAIVTFQKALLKATTINDKRSEATALMHLGTITSSLGNYGEAIALLFRSSNLFEKINDSEGTSEVQVLLQHTYREAGDYSNALRHALNVKEQLEKNDRKGVFVFRGIRRLPLVLAEIGETYQHMNKLDSAEYYTRKAIDEQLMFNGAIWNFPIYLLGKIQAKQGEFGEALSNYRSAIPLAIKNGVLKDTLDIYNSIAELYKNTGVLDSAIYYAKSITNKRLLNIKILLKAETTLADVYKLRHNTDSAFKYLELTSALKDSIYNTEKQKQFQSAIFNEQLRQQESAERQQELRSRIIMYALIGGLIFFLIIAVLLYRNNLQKQNAKVKIEKAFDELKATQKQLIQSEKMASLGELTAGIAHEIQNPLNFVNNFSEVNEELIDELKQELAVGNRQSAEEIAKDIKGNQQKILHHGKRADAIVKGMLQHSRSSSGTKEPTDINALADEYLRLAYHGLRAKDKSFNAKFETHLDDSIGMIEVVPQDIGRVILNLITNAFYAVSEKMKRETVDVKGDSYHVSPLPYHYEPTVTITTKKLNDKIEIQVKDNGNGIPEHIKEKIFQPFFTTKPAGQGTGLGLSMSYEIVTQVHNGQLKVETKEGEGSEFSIVLPQ
jgi:two-component system, NtrC family, sensor kinase